MFVLASSDVTMVDHVFFFKTDQEDTFLFSKFFGCRLRNLAVDVFCHVLLFLNFMGCVSFIYKAGGFLHIQRVQSVECRD